MSPFGCRRCLCCPHALLPAAPLSHTAPHTWRQSMPTKMCMKPAEIPLQYGGARAEARAIAEAAAASRCQPYHRLHPHLKASPPSAARCLSAAMASISCFCSAYAPWCRSKGRSLPACRVDRATNRGLLWDCPGGKAKQTMLADEQLKKPGEQMRQQWAALQTTCAGAARCEVHQRRAAGWARRSTNPGTARVRVHAAEP